MLTDTPTPTAEPMHVNDALERRRIALLGMAIGVIGVLLLANRCERALEGEGHTSGLSVFVVGLLVFVVPFGFAAYRIADGGRASLGLVVGVSTLATFVTARRQASDLAAAWFPYLLLPSVTALVVGRMVLRSIAARQVIGPPAAVTPAATRSSEQFLGETGEVPVTPADAVARANGWHRPTRCDQCSHPIDEHTLFPPNESIDGWMHCTVDDCQSCWHTWPKIITTPSSAALPPADGQSSPDRENSATNATQP